MEPRFIFFGTPRFATIVLDELAEKNLFPTLIVTSPDRPAGRGLALTAPPVKSWALSHTIAYIQPEHLDAETVKRLEAERPEVCVVAAYGKLLRKDVLNLPPRGALNVHPSLLPTYRGASPIEAQILADDPDVGVTIMLLDEKMDHGPIIAQQKVSIPEWPPYAGDLEMELAKIGGHLLSDILPKWITGESVEQAQDHERATYTKKITKEDGLLDLSADPRVNFLKIRAFDPWPGTYFFTDQGSEKIRVKITDAKLTDGKLEILRVVPEGRREMSYEDFMRGSGPVL